MTQGRADSPRVITWKQFSKKSFPLSLSLPPPLISLYLLGYFAERKRGEMGLSANGDCGWAGSNGERGNQERDNSMDMGDGINLMLPQQQQTNGSCMCIYNFKHLCAHVWEIRLELSSHTFLNCMFKTFLSCLFPKVVQCVVHCFLILHISFTTTLWGRLGLHNNQI